MSSHKARHGDPDALVPGDIAIIGMACLFPGAPDLDAYWQNIVSKVDAITDPPPEAWDADVFYDPESTANDRVYCKRGGFLGALVGFDPLQYGIMPLAVQGGEPDQWLALQVARAALADAGYVDEIPERHRTAVILGKGTYLNRGNAIILQHGKIVDQTLEILKTLHPEYTEAQLQLIRQQLKQGLPPFNADTAPGLIPNIIAGRIANRLDLMGPSYTVDAACASSLIAVDMASRDLLTHQCDLALVGGAHAATPVPVLMLFCQLGALSRREKIRPFDKDADGTILGEGVGMMVLKRREDAERDGNRIYAVIKGVGTSSDGRGLSVMAPRLEGELLALQRAYERAGISPRTIALIEAHGTGTLVGDATEVEALTRVFGPRDGAWPWCALGSVKSMIGHLMPAAGMAGLIKTALALYHKVLPPTLNVDEPDPKLELEKGPFYINTETRPWIHGAQPAPRRAGVNAFGFGGINAHVILEEYPVTDSTTSQTHHRQWDSEVCILSAASRVGLTQRIQQVQNFLRAGSQVHLRDLAYTLSASLDEGPYRLAIVAATVEDLQHKLNQTMERLSDPRCRQIKDVRGMYFFEQPLAASGQLAFLFPGEGSQYVNMMADLCIHFPEVREYFDLMDRVFAEHTRNYVPSDYIFPRPTFSESQRREAEDRLWQMEGAVEAVLTANRALFALLSRLQIRPDAVVGHSTGEYSAMFASGMIELVNEAQVGQFAMELNRIYREVTGEGEVPRAALVAVGADAETVSGIIGQSGVIHVAMDNCPHQTVVVGREDAVEQAVKLLRSRGLIYECLPFDRPYHTPLFEAFGGRLQAFFRHWLVSPPRLKTYSCTTGSPFPPDLARIQEVAVEHWMRPVRFRETIEAMYADGVRIFVEVGPKGNLTAFVDDILRGRPHLVVPANVTTRSGITQLNHLVGMLAAQGVLVRPDYLYARRSPCKLALDRADDSAGSRRKPLGRMKLATGWPPMSLSEETATSLRAQMRPEPAVPSRPGPASETSATLSAVPASHQASLLADTEVERAPSRTVSQPPASPETTSRFAGYTSSEPHTRTSGPAVRDSSAAQVISAHFQTMEQFLAVQQQVMQVFLAGQAAAPAASPSSAVSVGRAGESSREGSPLLQEAAPAAGDTVRRSSPQTPERQEATHAPSPTPPGALPKDDGVGQAAPVEAGPLNAKAISDMLLRLVSERTGYPIEMLDLNLNLEADLGIDSIKRVEILGSLQQQSGLSQPEDMEVLASRKTLQEVIDFLVTRRKEPADPEPVLPSRADREVMAPASTPLPSMPFLGTIVSFVPGEELVALREISLEEDLFLRDHTLGREVSVADPELRGLPVMPLTMSMEMLAEAAGALVPGQHLLGMRNIRAYRWILLQGDRLTLKLVARRTPSVSGHEVSVQILEADAPAGSQAAAGSLIIEGTMVFGEAYPAPPPAGEFPLRKERPSTWSSDRLYEDGMFHGPAFRGVVSMDRWGEDGAEATLQVLPTSALFRSNSNPSLITDPVLLDQPGQVVGFWMAEHLETGYVVFPFRLEALHFYGSSLLPSERVTCRARIALIGERQVRSDLDIVRSDGRIWARFVGWEDRRFDLPRPFFRFLLSPRDVMVSTPWPAPVAPLEAHGRFQCCRLDLAGLPQDFFDAHGGLWREVLVSLILSRREQELWKNLRMPEPRRLEWLLGRMVAKDAVRRYQRQQYGLHLCPTDIEILPDGDGRPVAGGAWIDQVPSVPIISLSHTAGVAAAIAGEGDAGAGVGVDIERVDRMTEATEALAFTAQEQALLSSVRNMKQDDWPLRFWCAKEAVAKALGQGMVGGPRALVVQALDAQSGMVQVGLTGDLARRVPQANGLPLTAFTAREGDLIVAACHFRSMSQKQGEDGEA